MSFFFFEHLPFYMCLLIRVLHPLNLSTQINLSGQTAPILWIKLLVHRWVFDPSGFPQSDFEGQIRALGEKLSLFFFDWKVQRTGCQVPWLEFRCVLLLSDFAGPNSLTFQVSLAIFSVWCFCVPPGRSPGTNHILVATQEWFCSLLNGGFGGSLVTIVGQRGWNATCLTDQD